MFFLDNNLDGNIDLRVKSKYASSYTVNLETFARVLFSRNFAYANFVKIKSSQNHSVVY